MLTGKQDVVSLMSSYLLSFLKRFTGTTCSSFLLKLFVIFLLSMITHYMYNNLFFWHEMY